MQLKTNNDIIRCYACTKEATSREHVPARCFFPKGYRINLQTVPSCKKHNQDNSLNVEYVRNIITSCFQVNNIGFSQFEEKSYRSVTRNTRMIKRMFTNVKPAVLNGKDTGSVEVNLEMLDKVFNLMGKALYYYDFNKRFTHKFRIFPASLFFNNSINQNHRKNYSEFLKMLNSLKYEEVKTGNPKVFNYYRYNEDKNIFYKTILYEGFVVFLTYMDKTI